MIEAIPTDVERHQFGHALIQQVLYGEMSPIRRARLHVRIGDSLEELYGEEAEAHAGELAHHFAQGESIAGPGKLVRYSLIAGEGALGKFAYEDALTHFERGLVARGIALSEKEAASDEEAAALLFGLGRAQAATFERLQYHEALNSLTRAFDYYVEIGDIHRAVAIAEQPIPLVAGQEAELGQLLPRALALVPPDSHEAARIMSRYTRGVAGVGEASEALDRALTIARREGDIALEIRSLASAGRHTRTFYRYQESLEILRQATDLAQRNNDLHSEVVALYWAGLVQSNLGDLAGMKLASTAGLHAAERLRDRPWLALTLWNSQMAAKLEGAWQAARDFGDRALTVSPRERRILYSRALAEYEVGDFDQGELFLERLLDTMRQTSPGSNPEYSFVSCLIPMVAWITGKSERFEIAEEASQVVLSNNHSDGLGEFGLFARTGLGLMAVLGGNAAAAREQYATLESLRGRMLVLGGMANDRFLGLLSQTMENPDQAAEHFEDALTFCRKASYRPELAWSCHDYADLLIQRSAEGDRAKASSLLDESLAISGELSMRPLMERVAALQERAEDQPVRAPAYPVGLTQREVEVLRLISGGKTDREIGQELFISVNTVGNHVSSILNKTNTANRTEAATYAALNGIAAEPKTD